MSTKQSEFGIGQTSIVRYKYLMVDFLPYMFCYEIVIVGANPSEKFLLMTLFAPFDLHTWIFTFGLTIAAFLVLVSIQKLGSDFSNDESHTDYIFQDLCHAVVFFEESLPLAWFNRRGFTKSRKFILLQWLFFGTVIVQSYKSVLRTSLITITYEKGIDTFEDFDNSGLPLIIPKPTAPYKLLASDPRPVFKRIFGRKLPFLYNGQVPDWVRDM